MLFNALDGCEVFTLWRWEFSRSSSRNISMVINIPDLPWGFPPTLPWKYWHSLRIVCATAVLALSVHLVPSHPTLSSRCFILLVLKTIGEIHKNNRQRLIMKFLYLITPWSNKDFMEKRSSSSDFTLFLIFRKFIQSGAATLPYAPLVQKDLDLSLSLDHFWSVLQIVLYWFPDSPFSYIFGSQLVHCAQAGWKRIIFYS